MFRKVEISHRTILFTVFLLIGLWFLYSILDILLLLFVSFVVSAAMRPNVEWMERHRIPRSLAIFLNYAVVIGLMTVTVVSIVPALIVQTSRFAQSFPSAVSRILPNFNTDISSVVQQVAPVTENLLKLTLGIFSNIITVVMVFVFAFYMLIERKRMRKYFEDFVGGKRSESLLGLLGSIEEKLGGWVQGELILMGCIGIMTYVGLMVLRVDYALPLALFAGFAEIIPTFGPIISAVPSILLALSVSPVLALSVAALYFIVQQLENNLVVPVVMKRSVGLSPLVTILALLVGDRIAGVGGAILAIPIVLVIQEIIRFLLNRNTREDVLGRAPDVS